LGLIAHWLSRRPGAPHEINAFNKMGSFCQFFEHGLGPASLPQTMRESKMDAFVVPNIGFEENIHNCFVNENNNFFFNNDFPRAQSSYARV